ncbi:N-acetylmuramoyl-L-alanine amidase [Polymorphobacter sp.]|uniref:N-acetylmuramoyl-L-alanine amidase n=1 Tax=Polymorphobacter sp. TaxID=1909290 RepID=UPI003F6EFE74
MIERPSPNHDARRLPVSMVVVHYTGMHSAAAALDRLCDPEAKVSAHWLIAEDGQLFRLVDEDRRAWHAGAAYWRAQTDINSVSVGIELANPGHEWGYLPFPEEQIVALETLIRDIYARHPDVRRDAILGHSDVAPRRKQDPGELFDWPRLAAAGLTMPMPTADVDPNWLDSGFMAALSRYGYDISWPEAAVTAFQRRFRPADVSGTIDAESRALLLSLMRGPAR